MTENINVGSITSGNAIVGGRQNTISGSAVVNVHADQLDQLRALLDKLIQVINDSGAQPEVLAAAEQARAEAACPDPEPKRLRMLVDAVIRGSARIRAVSEAALSVIGVITMIEKAVH